MWPVDEKRTTRIEADAVALLEEPPNLSREPSNPARTGPKGPLRPRPQCPVVRSSGAHRDP